MVSRSDRERDSTRCLTAWHTDVRFRENRLVYCAGSLASSTTLSVGLDFWVDNTHVARKRVVARKGLLLTTHRTPHLLLAVVVDGVLVACEVVRPREDGVARLVGGGVDPRALVRSRLGVTGHESSGCHPGGGRCG